MNDSVDLVDAPLAAEPDAHNTPGFDIMVLLHMLDGKQEEFGARIRQVKKGCFELWSPIGLLEGRRLHILYLGRSIEAEVLDGRKLEDGGYSVRVRLSAGEASVRKELRLPVDVTGTLKFPGKELMVVRIIDMAQSGLGMLLPAAVPVGTSASLDLADGVVFGEIRYCKPHSENCYRAAFVVEEFVAKGFAVSRRGGLNWHPF